ncbi:DUF2690 domain-containing protein [Rhodococcus sp. 14-2483-1-2]|uniref:DUF2690 domain-containing protein n=1 Tax=Rhodococcus sp. 14-2483-1-2 TaxID=2023147 RepID=UPI000B9AE43F|nr:DUF2690 domain-containing protein [Rhodococcus sp. 14-2483-1-2]OZF26030.1 hypothetical protein CH295_25670 [Rhodococcus sp. 14-2483-1-2]
MTTNPTSTAPTYSASRAPRQHSPHRRRHWFAVWLIACFSIAALGLGTGSASAGSQHNGTNPATTGCNQNASLVATRGIQTESGQVVSYVDVYYSHSCSTNWIRVRNNPAGGAAVKSIWTANYSALNEVDYGSGSSYSMQVYAPGATCVYFQVHLKHPNGQHYAETYTAGANAQVIC